MVIAALTLLLTPAQTPVAEMDFELVGGRIYVPIELNGHKTSAILDSGAGMAVMDLGLADQWKLASQGTVPVGGIGKERVTGKILTDSFVTFAGSKTPMRIAIPLESMATAEGRRMETIIGFEFLQGHVVEVDYVRKHLRIFDAKEELPTRGFSAPIRLVQNHPHLTSEVRFDGKTFAMETMVDSGASGSGLTAKFLKANPVSGKKTPIGVIGGGVGGFIRGSFFRPDYVKLGDTALANPIVSLSEAEAGGASGAGSSYDLLLGADVLKRFKVTFDYPHRRILFEPNGDVAKPFEADKTGMRVFASGTDLRTFKVVGVLEGSSSSDAGLRVDDVIETVDGKPASIWTLQALREEFRSPTAKGWDLGIHRGGDRLKVRLVAKSVI
jgi:hypothetical protein